MPIYRVSLLHYAALYKSSTIANVVVVVIQWPLKRKHQIAYFLAILKGLAQPKDALHWNHLAWTQPKPNPVPAPASTSIPLAVQLLLHFRFQFEFEKELIALCHR